MRGECEQLAHHARGRKQVFKVIEQQEETLALEMTVDALGQRLSDPLPDAEDLRDRREDKRGIRDRRERNQEDAILEILYELRGHTKRKPRLTRAARSRQGDDARLA